MIVPLPVPANGTDRFGFTGSFVTKTSEVVSSAAVLGAKLTLTVQDMPAASEPPQVVVFEKSGALPPVSVIEVIVSEAVPTFDSVTLVGPAVPPSATVPKFTLPGVTLACGAVAGLTVKGTGAVGAEVPAEFVADTSKL